MRRHASNEVVREEGIRWLGSARLSHHQPERGSKGCRDAEELDRDVTGCWRTRIVSQPLFPRETRMRALRAGQDHVRGAWRSGGRWRQADLDALVSHELHAGTPVLSAAPISPEHRCGTYPQRMQKHAHLTRLRSRVAIPLTLLAQRTRAAVANAGRIHHAQTSIGLATPLLGVKRLSCWTEERPIRLERKVGSGEATRFPGGGAGGWTIPRGGRGGGRAGSSLLALRREGRGKFGGVQGRRGEPIAQFQAEVPHPLRDHLPALLPPGRVRAPPIGVLFAVFI